MTRRDERRQVRHRAAADEKTARAFRQFAHAAEPTDDSTFERGRRRATEPGAVENVEPGGECIRHRADEIVWPGHKREEARMIDMQIVREDFALELRQQFA